MVLASNPTQTAATDQQKASTYRSVQSLQSPQGSACIDDNSQSDYDLVSAAIAGDSESISTLYQRHYVWVFRFLLAHLGNVADAEDASQEVFVRLVAKCATFRGESGTFAGWLFRVAQHVLYDHFRSHHRRTTTSLSHADGLANLADPNGDADRHLEIAEVSAHIRSLPKAQRDVLVLRFASGLSLRETAAVLGKAEGTVKALQFQALSALRKLMQ